MKRVVCRPPIATKRLSLDGRRWVNYRYKHPVRDGSTHVVPVPLVLLSIGLSTQATSPLFIAFGVQYVGLLAERWFFFAQANHPQNLYYQTV